ncbi:MAG: ECF transporter S component [Bacillota bacterium]
MDTKLRMLVRVAMLLALALAVQSAGLQQAITGPLINAILLLAGAYTGLAGGVLVGLITPWVALTMGILKLAPAVPVIMAGNAVLVLTFVLVRRLVDTGWREYLGAGVAAVAKYVVMTLGIKLIVAPGVAVPPPAMFALTTMQLYTALGGGLLAVLVIRSLSRTGWGRS